MTETLDVEFEREPTFALRGRQPEWLAAIERDLITHDRLLVVAPGGVGKTELAAALCTKMHARGLRTLVLENRDRLTHQTAERIAKSTGIDVEVEMGDLTASPFAPIVVACVQSLGRVNRLTGFSDFHFGAIIPDEAHFSMSPQWQRILRYFHYGAESLAEGWETPPDGTYAPKAKIVGLTATPNIGERRSLAEFYQMVPRGANPGWTVDYSYLEAVQDGWLVAPVMKNIPVKIDLRKFKAASTPTGMDFRTQDLSVAMIPIIEELAAQVVLHASDKKTIAFLPSVECARMLADSLCRRGLQAWLVAGECLETGPNTDAFVASGPGCALCNAAIYNAGVDFPDVDCIAWFRATLSRAFFIQGIYRGTRVLPGVIDGLTTADGRRAAIAASLKPSLLILDPLFVSDRIDLLDAYDLFTEKEEVKAKMKAAGPPTAESAKEAERDFIKALEKEARKHARKVARVIDPLAFAVSLGDERLASWKPESPWEMTAPTQGQLDFLTRNHVDVSKITSKGLAQKVIGIVLTRLRLHLATIVQLDFLHKLGVDQSKTSTLTQSEASSLIDRTLAQKRNHP